MIGQLFGAYRRVALRSSRRGQHQLWPLPGAQPNIIRLLGSDTGSGDGSSGKSGSNGSTSPPSSEEGFKTRFRRYMPRQRPYQLPRWVAPEEVDAMIDDSGRATNPHCSEREPLDYDTKREASMDPVSLLSIDLRLTCKVFPTCIWPLYHKNVLCFVTPCPTSFFFTK